MFFQATDLSYLTVVTNNPNGDCDRIHGTFKITGVGTFAIENCGGCDCTLVIKQVDDNASHPPYDDSGLITDDSQLPAEVMGGQKAFITAFVMPDDYVRSH